MSDHALEEAAAAVLCGMKHLYLTPPEGANVSVKQLRSHDKQCGAELSQTSNMVLPALIAAITTTAVLHAVFAA